MTDETKKLLREVSSAELARVLMTAHLSATMEVMHEMGTPITTLMDSVMDAAAVHMAGGLIALINKGELDSEKASELIHGLGEAIEEATKAHFAGLYAETFGDIPIDDDGTERDDDEGDGDNEE